MSKTREEIIADGATQASPFIVGEAPPPVWVHMEFDWADTLKYVRGAKISDEREARRLTRKYFE